MQTADGGQQLMYVQRPQPPPPQYVMIGNQLMMVVPSAPAPAAQAQAQPIAFAAAPPQGRLESFLLVVDGYSAPVTAGNFVDLCMRGFFNGLPLAFDELSAPADGRVLSMSKADAGGGALAAVVAGRFGGGFVDPITAKVRAANG